MKENTEAVRAVTTELVVTVSGDYRTGTKVGSDVIDFEGVVGKMPDCPEDFIMFHVQNRMLPIWIKADKRYPQRFEMMRTVYIDKVERVQSVPAIIGKNIKELSWEELQELAVLKNLRHIPPYRSTDLRSAREVSYLEYSEHILGNKINVSEKNYNYADLPALIIDGGGKKASNPKLKTNEDAISHEQESKETISDSEDTFTLDELKKLAKKKGIKLPANVSYDRAYEIVIADKK